MGNPGSRTGPCLGEMDAKEEAWHTQLQEATDEIERLTRDGITPTEGMAAMDTEDIADKAENKAYEEAKERDIRLALQAQRNHITKVLAQAKHDATEQLEQGARERTPRRGKPDVIEVPSSPEAARTAGVGSRPH